MSDRCTAAEPRSLAAPDSGCCSLPMRSTTTSMPLLSSSVISTANSDMMSTARSRPVSPSQIAAGTSSTHSAASMRKASSFFSA
ncbi:hypothetical protein D3C83_101560 [compost metagenome]